MAKYIFIQDFKTGTYVPSGQGRPSVMVSFKKGDTIDGTFLHNEGQSESDFVTTQTPSGEVRIPFGGELVRLLFPHIHKMAYQYPMLTIKIQ